MDSREIDVTIISDISNGLILGCFINRNVLVIFLIITLVFYS